MKLIRYPWTAQYPYTPWLVAALWLAVGIYCWPYTADDAFIVARYALNLAHGRGYSFNPGVPSDGITGPLWIFPGFFAAQTGLDPVATAKTVSLFCTALAAFFLIRRARRRALGAATSCILLFLLGVQPTPPTWAIGGLETGAATFILTSTWFAASRRPTADAIGTGFCAALLLWLRPELAPFGFALVGWTLWRGGKRAWPAVFIALLGLVALWIWRYWLFKSFVPLSLWAKPAELGNGVSYVTRAVLLTTGLGGLALCAVATARGRSDDRLLGWLLAFQLGGLIVAGGDWMPGFRLFAPLVPLYALSAARGVVLLARAKLGRSVAALCLVAACGAPLADLAARLGDLREAGFARQRVGAEISQWLRHNAHRVALVDIGYFGYTSGLEVVDLAGLIDVEIAHLPGGHVNKRVSPALLQLRAPETILLHSSRPVALGPEGVLLSLDGFPVEKRLAASPWLRERYRAVRTWRYADRYYYVALQTVDKR